VRLRIILTIIPALFSLSYIVDGTPGVTTQTLFAKSSPIEKAILQAMAGKSGTCVFVDCKSGEIFASDTAAASERLAPCSTFKIWNTLIGLECKIISSADELFYTWDGQKRFLDVWNRDQTLKQAFQVSCVPAYQALARNIGKQNMKKWIEKIGYGDKDISSGIDDFWLPRKGKKPILISTKEQALLIRKLIIGELPFSENAQKVLREIMAIKKTSNGTFYGKTGSRMNFKNNPELDYGWFVGYVQSKEKTYSFSCLVKGEKLTGKNAKVIIESILLKTGLL